MAHDAKSLPLALKLVGQWESGVPHTDRNQPHQAWLRTTSGER